MQFSKYLSTRMELNLGKEMLFCLLSRGDRPLQILVALPYCGSIFPLGWVNMSNNRLCIVPHLGSLGVAHGYLNIMCLN